MFSVDTVKVSELPFVSLLNCRNLPSVPGIYFVLDASADVRYIGLSKDLRARWMAHHKYDAFQSLGAISVAYLTVSDISLLSSIEVALIKHFKPDMNTSKGG